MLRNDRVAIDFCPNWPGAVNPTGNKGLKLIMMMMTTTMMMMIMMKVSGI